MTVLAGILIAVVALFLFNLIVSIGIDTVEPVRSAFVVTALEIAGILLAIALIFGIGLIVVGSGA